MPLVNISAAPETDDARRQYDFSHHQDHLEIIRAIEEQTGKKLPLHPIWPVGDHDAFVRAHQQMHTDMVQALELPNAADLQVGTPEAIDRDWFWRNYWEHEAARKKLRI